MCCVVVGCFEYLRADDSVSFRRSLRKEARSGWFGDFDNAIKTLKHVSPSKGFLQKGLG